MLKIVTIPNPVLTGKVQPVNKIDQKIKRLVKEMQKTLALQNNPQGVGLAAPQVNVALAIFIIKPIEKAKIQTFINPKIIQVKNNPAKAGQARKESLEGCLSIPRIWSPLKRPDKVLVEYQDINGNFKKDWFSGFSATVIQHEMDHLQGILFTQRAIEQNKSLYEEKIGKLEKLEF